MHRGNAAADKVKEYRTQRRCRVRYSKSQFRGYPFNSLSNNGTASLGRVLESSTFFGAEFSVEFLRQSRATMENNWLKWRNKRGPTEGEEKLNSIATS